MFDFSMTEMGVVAVVALIVLGPERLPKVARTIGTLYGRVQGYMRDLRLEVDRHIELDELKNLKSEFEGELKNVQSTIQATANDLNQEVHSVFDGNTVHKSYATSPSLAELKPVQKHWRVRQGSRPIWYKNAVAQKSQILSASARVKKYRPNASKTKFL